MLGQGGHWDHCHHCLSAVPIQAASTTIPAACLPSPYPFPHHIYHLRTTPPPPLPLWPSQDKINEIGMKATEHVLNSDESRDKLAALFTEVFADRHLQRDTGDALWNATWYSVTPSVFVGVPLQRRQPPPSPVPALLQTVAGHIVCSGVDTDVGLRSIPSLGRSSSSRFAREARSVSAGPDCRRCGALAGPNTGIPRGQAPRPPPQRTTTQAETGGSPQQRVKHVTGTP